MQCKERLCAGNLMLERGRREEAATRGANAFCAKSAYVRACPWVLQGFRVTVYGFTVYGLGRYFAMHASAQSI